MADRAHTYQCATGHLIPAADLSAETEVVVLDRGADVRICRRHGVPVAVMVAAVTGQTEMVNRT